MKKRFIVNVILLSVLSAGGLMACKNKHVGHRIDKELRVDSSLASLAKPVNARVVSAIPAITPEPGMRIFSVDIKGVITYDTRNQITISSRVSGRVEKLYIKYNFQPIKKGQLIMEIYSPDLAAAQRELLFIARSGNDDNMMQKARQRLLLLGMQPAQIDRLIKTGNVLYRVPVYGSSNGHILEKQASVTINSPVLLREGQYINAGQSLFTIYKAENLVAEFALKPALAAHIKTGQKLVFRAEDGEDKVYTGIIGLIQPVVRTGEHFTLTRVYIDNKGFLPGQLVTAKIPLVHKTGWWLPAKAVWRPGNNAVVFKKEADAFVPQTVKTGVEAAGMIQVLTDISDWQVAENASYLVDSDSFIKTPDQPKK